MEIMNMSAYDVYCLYILRDHIFTICAQLSLCPK